MSEEISEAIPEANIVEGHSTPFVLAIVLALLAVFGGILYVGYLKVRDSLPELASIELPNFEEVAIPPIELDQLSQSIEQVTQTVEEVSQTVTEASINSQSNKVSNTQPLASYPSSRISFLANGDTLQVYRNDSELLFELKKPTDGISWVGVIRDPYTPLSNISGNPFFDQNTYPMIPRKDNVVALFDNKAQVIPFWNDLLPFTFFSETPDTIGFMVGTPRIMEFNSETTFYFIDMQRSFFTTFKTREVGFPRWVDYTVYPPSFATDKYIRLSQKYPGLGGVVIDQVQSFQDAEYQEDSELRKKLYLEEFKTALLSKDELQQLTRRQFEAESDIVTEYIQPLQKFVKLLYYGKRAGKHAALKELLSRTHPSLQKAIAKNNDLNPNTP